MLQNRQFLKYIQPVLDEKRLPKGKILFKSLFYKIFYKKYLIKVKSFSDPKIYYNINLKSLTCSCPSFIKNHSRYSINYPRRLCKHLVKIFAEKNNLPSFLKFYKSEVQFLAEKRSGFYHCKYRIDTLINNKRLEVFANDYNKFEDNFCVAVFYDGKRYFYNLTNQCWLYYLDGCPEDAEQIVEWINSHFDIFLHEPISESNIVTTFFNKGKVLN